MQPVDGRPGETEDRRQKGERGRQHEGDRDDRGRREAVHERQAHHEQPQQGDDHRGPGEQYGAAGRRESHDGGVSGGPPLGQSLPVAGDDEEGVVDADAEADHDHDVRAEGGHGDEVAECLQDPEAHAYSDQGGENRQAHGDHRPEGEEHDHDGGQQADRLARPGCGRDDLLDRCAPDRHLQARSGEAARGADHPAHGARGQVGGRGVELDHHEADPAVVRQLLPGAAGERTLHARDVCQGSQGPH